MFNLKSIVHKAYHSPFYLWLLNQSVKYIIPFNRPHAIQIKSLSPTNIVVTSPLKRNNKNHLNGMHACNLATVCEFTTGFLLISNLDPKKYRLILKEIKVEYLYQAKTVVLAQYAINPEAILKQVENDQGVSIIECDISLYDLNKNKVCEGMITWQVKEWSKVASLS
jgi:acyl-coenzyme A thioesterase PaaI-like protein